MYSFKITGLLKQSSSKFVARRISSLYVTGDKGNSVYSVLVPHIDFDDRVKHLPRLKRSLVERGVDVNIESLINLWDEYKNLKDIKMILDNRKIDIAEKIKAMVKAEPAQNEINQLKLLGKFVRRDLKTASSAIWNIEKKVIFEILKLPNDLDPITGSNEIEISKYMRPKDKTFSHLEISKALDIVDYFDQRTYFLKKNAAIFELSTMAYFTDAFMRDGFIIFSNPDFSKRILLEGCALDDASSQIFKLERKSHEDQGTDAIYLNGGPSVFSFCAHHAKTIIDETSLPIRYVTKGRQYVNKPNEEGLYGVWQNSCVQVFVGCSENQSNTELSKIVSSLTFLYESLGLPFRTIYASSKMLSAPEKLRVCFQIHSPFHKKYMDVGHVSVYGDFLSKRLRMYFSDAKDLHFLHLISGTLVTVPPLLACSLENNREHFFPSCLNPYMIH